jgi:Fur family transcriptional regulator, ferric uptake regulator
VPLVETDDLIEEIRRAGMRITVPRRAICEVLAQEHDEHLTAPDLHRRAEEITGTSIAPSTVYRTIETLESVGRVHHVHLGHGPAVIHLSGHADHHHLVCEVCGRTEDIPLDELSELIDHLESSRGFVVGGVHFALVGHCSEHDDDRNSS